jgi:polyisoprenoid-binding protein YceI
VSEFTITAHGTLTVAGVERPIDLSVAARREGEGIRLKGTRQLRMTEFEIKPPKMMMGTLRTGDQVTVTFDLLVGAREPSAAVPPRD